MKQLLTLWTAKRPLRRFTAKGVSLGVLMGLLLIPTSACDRKDAAEGTEAEVEKLPDIKPNLPEVPNLPPPPHPIKLSDGSYTIYGLRKKKRDTIDEEVEVTGLIVKVYEPPPCDSKDADACPKVLSPHVWIADTFESEQEDWMKVTDYATNKSEVDKARSLAQRGAYKPPPAETGLPPVPTDFDEGKKVKVRGRFTHVSSQGFNDSRGLLEYQGHQTLGS